MTESSFKLDHFPVGLQNAFHGVTASPVLVGESGVNVYRLQASNSPTRFLKIATGNTRRDLHVERARLEWLRGKLPVPSVLYFEEDSTAQYLLLSAIDGVDASQLVGHSDPVHLISALAQALRQVHTLGIQNCPFDRRLETVFGVLGRRIAQSSADEDDDVDDWRNTSFQMHFEQLMRTQPRDEDLVFVHGDYCFPNILLDTESLAVTGFIDWGRSGIADRYQDLALAARSIIRNVGPRWVGHFFEAYGIQHINSQKVRFYQLLDEML
jgi:aminoglycoside phosphotransferase